MVLSGVAMRGIITRAPERRRLSVVETSPDPKSFDGAVDRVTDGVPSTMRIKTWHIEAGFDALLLGGVVLATTPADVTAWLGAVAVWISARHASVADRLREAEEERAQTSGAVVDCVSWLDRYWVMKEICWIAYFICLGAWPALVGAIRFLLWPWWRRWYRRRWPRDRADLPRARVGR